MGKECAYVGVFIGALIAYRLHFGAMAANNFSAFKKQLTVFAGRCRASIMRYMINRIEGAVSYIVFYLNCNYFFVVHLYALPDKVVIARLTDNAYIVNNRSVSKCSA